MVGDEAKMIGMSPSMTLAFFRSAIHCGDAWSQAHEDAYESAMGFISIKEARIAELEAENARLREELADAEADCLRLHKEKCDLLFGNND